ncbi:MAG: Calx-beta domain-containing protein, partial [Anaerolineae bacterium]
VDYATHDGPPGPGGATAGADYTETHGILTIPAGSLEGQIEVDIQSDNVYEGDEVLAVELSDPAHASLTDALAQGTIVDDDSPPIIAFQAADYAVGEGEAGGSAAITVTLSGATALTATIGYETQDGTAGPADYAAISGTLTFTPGISRRTFQVDMADDLLDEPDETVLLALHGASNANLGQHEATLTIHDDDAPPLISIGDGALDEADMSILLPVTLTAPSSFEIEVQYAGSDGTGPAGAQAGEDYIAASGTLTLPAGTESTWARVTLLDDDRYELDETFLVTLHDPLHATLGDAQATAMIANDDDPPQIGFETDLYSVDEEAVTATLTVTLSGPTAVTATVGYATTDGPPPGSAEQGKDYVPVGGTLAFRPDETQQTIAIPLLDDAQPEARETFVVTLENAVHSTIGELPQATVRINDGDGYRVYLPLVQRQAAIAAQAVSLATAQHRPAVR